jgi:hypothetical protein
MLQVADAALAAWDALVARPARPKTRKRAWRGLRNAWGCGIQSLLPQVIDFTARSAQSAYLFCVALERRTRADAYFGQRGCGGRAMLPFDSYREVLSEHIQGRHVVASAWIVLVAVGVLIMMLA